MPQPVLHVTYTPPEHQPSPPPLALFPLHLPHHHHPPSWVASRWGASGGSPQNYQQEAADLLIKAWRWRPHPAGEDEG
jgi:hypothetical protein